MNRLYNHLFLFLIIVLLNGCTTFKAVRLVNSGQVVTNNKISGTVPFSLNGHPILIKAKLNNSQKNYTFIFDTGALTFIRQSVANELALQTGIEVKAKGSAGNITTIHLTQLKNISVGNMEVSDCATGVLNEDEFSELFPQTIDGILGSNFLRFFVVTLDFKSKEITLSHTSTSPAASQNNAIEIPFKLDMKQGFAPKLSCIIDDNVKSDAVIDTGTPYTSVSVPLIKRTDSFKNGKVIKAIGSMNGGLAGQSSEDFALRINTINFETLQLHHLPVRSTSSGILIGNDILNKYFVTLDYPAGRMILIPNGESFEKNPLMYPIGLKKQNKKVVVSGMWENSSVEKCGIKIGDQITRINSIEAPKLSNLELAEIFLSKQKNTVDIEYENETGKHNLLLKKERLLPIINE